MYYKYEKYNFSYFKKWGMDMKEPKGRFAGTVRVGEKGQIVIPKGARDLLNIQPGDTLLVLADEKRGIAITKDDVLLRQFEALLGPEEPS